MVERYLVETDFLFALNPNDTHHHHVLAILQDAARGSVKLFLSPASLIESSLLLKSRGFSDENIARILKSFRDAIRDTNQNSIL